MCPPFFLPGRRVSALKSQIKSSLMMGCLPVRCGMVGIDVELMKFTKEAQHERTVGVLNHSGNVGLVLGSGSSSPTAATSNKGNTNSCSNRRAFQKKRQQSHAASADHCQAKQLAETWNLSIAGLPWLQCHARIHPAGLLRARASHGQPPWCFTVKHCETR